MDTEFHEYKKRTKILGGMVPIGEGIPTIDLISIGIVTPPVVAYNHLHQPQPTQYYAVSSEFDFEDAWNNKWLRENVFPSILRELSFEEREELKEEGMMRNRLPGISSIAGTKRYKRNKRLLEFYKGDSPLSERTLRKETHRLIKKYGKSIPQIRTEILSHIRDVQALTRNTRIDEYINVVPGEFKSPFSPLFLPEVKTTPRFYGYYADYDWVLFAWMFGRMVDLPKEFPFHCIDIKQMMDAEGVKRSDKGFPQIDKSKHHNALSDAVWHMDMYNFVMDVSNPAPLVESVTTTNTDPNNPVVITFENSDSGVVFHLLLQPGCWKRYSRRFQIPLILLP